MNFMTRCVLYCAAAAGLVPGSVYATIVRMDFAIGQQPDSVYVQLFDAETPLTVANFLRYIEDDVTGERRYDNTFIHRSVPNFVIQGGGFIFAPGTPFFLTPHIPIYPTIDNEFKRSNLRGTITMAKLEGDPDSASSEWFFNLVDNSVNLDNQNGGFTVFGEVLGDGMDVVDTIAALPIRNEGDGFQRLPVANLAIGDTTAEQNLVRITGIVVDPPASISADIVNHDFGSVPVSAIGRVTITLQNNGPTDLSVNAIGVMNPLVAPFSVDSANDGCSSQPLAFGESCVFDVLFSPTVEGSASDSFSIETSDVILPELTIQVRGNGPPIPPTLEVSPTSIDLGNVGTGEPVQRTITVSNIGAGELFPTEPVISGVNAAEVSLDDGCVQQPPLALASGESCDITMTLTAPLVGAYSATITVNAEPEAQSIPVTVTAAATLLEPEIRMPIQINMGDTVNGQEIFGLVSMDNVGIDTLYVADIQFIGENSALLSVTDVCIQAEIPAGSRCVQQVTFAPEFVPLGDVRSTMRINSNDPDTPVLDIPVVATVSTDKDGVPDAVEAAAPNGGDGNLDGIPDILQENVASLPGADGDYVSITSPDGTTLTEVFASGQSPATDGRAPISAIANARVEFRKGFFFFTVEGVPIGGTVAVTLNFPANLAENSYFKYGRLPGEPANEIPEHWYLFDFRQDSDTGVSFNGNVITLSLTDGGRGDRDQRADGRIVDPGGPAVVALNDSVGSSSGGGGGGCSMKRSDGGGRAFDLVWLLAITLLLRVGVSWRGTRVRG